MKTLRNGVKIWQGVLPNENATLIRNLNRSYRSRGRGNLQFIQDAPTQAVTIGRTALYTGIDLSAEVNL